LISQSMSISKVTLEAIRVSSLVPSRSAQTLEWGDVVNSKQHRPDKGDHYGTAIALPRTTIGRRACVAI